MSSISHGLAPFAPSTHSEFLTSVSQIPTVLKQWDAKAGEDGYLVFICKSPFALEGEDPWINLQFSIQDGDLGLDWVFLGPRNIEDWTRITEFITKAGHQVLVREMNDVLFLRVEDGDIAALGLSIVRDFYKIDGDAEIRVLATPPSRGTGLSS